MKTGVLALEAGRLGCEGLRLLQFTLQPLFLAIVEGALQALICPLQRPEKGREDAARRLQYLGRAELDSVQGSAFLLLCTVALLYVDGEERDADHAEDNEGRETACGAGLFAAHVVL
jgi:hypothetical protein